ncbi:DNA alkylation repair protein [Evansella halocellulosilytica]|uniref:DNA alkylation repair protein n=1 Tax=Evansella halocellulosilytica TaxID=2011013 RepID=UPI000BB7FECE|nr:DNA alkylation repair protein [Evansella halocellulosilytica]
MTKTIALKDYFGVELAERIADLIMPHYTDFPADQFCYFVEKQTPDLELKGRVAVIAEKLKESLPDDYPEALNILLHILGPENKSEQGMFTNGYFLMPVAYFVEKYGLEHLDLSMSALYDITKRHTSEYTIRPYLVHYPDECLILLNKWVHDDNVHVRRLVSEGSRPRLPWAKRINLLNNRIENNLLLLEPLLNDDSFYVRKSVANHLNDLTKDYRTETLAWLEEHLNNGGKHTKWMMMHALRSLVKVNDDAALQLLNKVNKS